MTLSRYRRPEDPLHGLVLQVRDHAVLDAIFVHRYLTSRHLQQLIFPNLSRRVVQIRLRKLWEHQFLDRRFMPVVVDADHGSGRSGGEPLYCLATNGAAVLEERRGIDLKRIPHTLFQNAEGYATLQHNLTVTDLLVSITVATRNHPEVALQSFERETTLRQRIYSWRRGGGQGEAIVPDGAFTLSSSAGKRPATFYVEVVRALVKGGNATLGKKLGRYLSLLRASFFRRAYGHEHIGGVLVVTPTERRAETLRSLAAHLPFGCQLFWFGSTHDADERSLLTAETILTRPWLTGDNQLVSFTTVGAVPAAPNRPSTSSHV